MPGRRPKRKRPPRRPEPKNNLLYNPPRGHKAAGLHFFITMNRSHYTEQRYSLATLLPLNKLYDHEHRLTQDDVDAANARVRHIERTRDPHIPKVGDRVRYTTRYGDFYAHALIDAVREDGTLSICLCPYVPFIWPTPDGIGCSASGGPFTDVAPRDLQPADVVQGDFKEWGHCGACGSGAVCFEAEVRQWTCREPDPLYGAFSTERWRKIRLYKDPERRGGDLYRATASRSERRRSSGSSSPTTKEPCSRRPIPVR